MKKNERTGLYMPERQLGMSLKEQRELFLPYIDTLTKVQYDRMFPSISGSSQLTGTWSEIIYANRVSFTAKASFTTEIAINDTTAEAEAKIPADFFLPGAQFPKVLHLNAKGIISSTATPTYTFSIRLGAAASITAVIVLGTAALTTASGAATQLWSLDGDVIVRTLGTTGASATGNGIGLLESPAGLATPFAAVAYGGAAQPGTFSTLDPTIANFVNFNVACSASSASNTITLLQLIVTGAN
jgi:hypothetical protein